MATAPVASRALLLRFDPVSGTLRQCSYTVEILNGAESGRSFPLSESMVLGTADEAAIQLEDSTVSRFHLKLTPRPEGVAVRDLGSTNGTYVRGVRVQSGLFETETTLTAGNARVRIRFDESQVATSNTEERFGDALGKSLAMRRLFGVLLKVAQTDASVVLNGETGTGKDVLARALHAHSPRREGPFVVLNCASIPAQLVESELFGHVRGAFTGASTDRDGAFQQAHHGTLFLDEVGELPLPVQTRFLRALSERTVQRLGDTQSHEVDVRIIAATHRDLDEAVKEKAFRQDLYFRLAVVPVSIPPLRERAEDLDWLAEHFWEEQTHEPPLPPGLLQRLRQHEWPGNVRELKNVIQRAAVLYSRAELEALTAAQFQDQLLAGTPLFDPDSESGSERDLIVRALQRCGGNQKQAAQLLGISRGTLTSRIKTYGLPRPRKP